MTTNKPEVKRYDCTSGGAQHCYGCYTMKEGELGNYVEWEAYEALQAECEALQTSIKQALIIAGRGRNATLIQRGNVLAQVEAHLNKAVKESK